MNMRKHLAPAAALCGLGLASLGWLIGASGLADTALVVPRIDRPSLLLYAAATATVVLAWRGRPGGERWLRLVLELLIAGAAIATLWVTPDQGATNINPFFAGFGPLDAGLILLIALAMLADHLNGRIGITISRCLVSVVIIICIAVAIVYAYDVPVRYMLDTGLLKVSATQLLPTVLLGVSVIALHPDDGLPGLLTDSTLPAAQLRVLLPAVLLLPILVGLIVLEIAPGLATSVVVALTALGSAIMAALVVMASTANLSVAENALFVREQALKGAAEPIFLTDHRQRDEPIVWINDAFERVTGYRRDDVIGKPWSVLAFTGEKADSARHALEEARATGRAATVTTQIARPHADPAWIRLSLSPVQSRTSVLRPATISHFVGFITDQTNERQRMQQLAESNARAEAAMHARDSFVGYIEHELRTPLSAAQTWIDLMQLNPTPETLEKGLDVLLQSVRTQTKLITDLSDAARVTAGQLTLDRQHFDLRESLEILCDEMGPDFEDAEVQLHTALPDEPVWLEGDEIRIQQVARNLLTNALRYNRPGGRVRLELAATHDTVTLIVSDTGRGLSPDALEHMFEPYWRAHEGGKGLGIGLAIARAIVEAHGGTLDAASQGTNQGATFTLRLPLHGARPETSVDVPLAGEPGSG